MSRASRKVKRNKRKKMNAVRWLRTSKPWIHNSMKVTTKRRELEFVQTEIDKCTSIHIKMILVVEEDRWSTMDFR